MLPEVSHISLTHRDPLMLCGRAQELIEIRSPMVLDQARLLELIQALHRLMAAPAVNADALDVGALVGTEATAHIGAERHEGSSS